MSDEDYKGFKSLYLVDLVEGEDKYRFYLAEAKDILSFLNNEESENPDDFSVHIEKIIHGGSI